MGSRTQSQKFNLQQSASCPRNLGSSISRHAPLTILEDIEDSGAVVSGNTFDLFEGNGNSSAVSMNNRFELVAANNVDSKQVALDHKVNSIANHKQQHDD